MLERLKEADKIVGTRRLVRAIQAGEIAEAYIARDADLFIVRQVRQACNEAGVRMVEVDSMISKKIPLAEGNLWMNKIYNREDGLTKIVFLCDENQD